MSGGSKAPKQQVADYCMSLHFGVCDSADSVEQIKVNDAEIWKGRQSDNGILEISKPELFGGPKKEGGVRGLVHVLMGGVTQTLSNALAAKLGGAPSTVPGFRGMVSLFFTGGGSQGTAGFYWSTNMSYMRPVDVTVRRAPKGFYPEKAMITRADAVPASATVIDRTESQQSYPQGELELPAQWQISQTGAVGYTPRTAFGGGTATWRISTISAGNPVVQEALTQPGPSAAQPPFGSSDNTGVIRNHASDMFGLATPFFINSYTGLNTGYFQELNGFSVGISSTSNGGVGKILAGNGNPSEVKTVDIGVHLAVTLDGKGTIYAIGSSIITVYDYNLNVIRTRAVTIPGLSPSTNLKNRAWVDTTTRILYVGVTSNIAGGTRLTAIDSDTLTVMQTFVLESRDSYDAWEFRVFGDMLVRTYSWNKNENPGDGTPFKLVYERIRLNFGSNDKGEANPAHIIYECLTNTDWGLGLPDTQIDTASFVHAADTLYDEGFGLSMLWAQQTTIEEFINDILSHIDGTYGVDPATGKIYLKLVRDDYDIDDLFELNEDNCTITRFQRKALGETANEVVVTWTNPDNEKEETVTVHDLANYAIQGTIISSSNNYYGIRSAALALRVAMRDLGKSSYPVASFEVEVDRTGWDKRSGDVVKVSSQLYGVSGLPMRIMSVDYGRPGESKVVMSLLEDVFQMPAGAYVDVASSQWVDSAEYPAPLAYTNGGSAPYYFVTRELGSAAASTVEYPDTYVMLMGAQNGSDTSSFLAMERTTDALGASSYQSIATIPLSGRAQLGEALVKEAVTLDLQLTNFRGALGAAQGGFIWIGEGDPKTSELVLVRNATGQIDVVRGVLDTTIKAWPAGTPVWFLSTSVDVSEPTLRIAGQTVNYKLLPTTSRGTLDINWAPVTSFTLDDRMHRPYRPANVTIGGVAFPTFIERTIPVTWSRRNRLLEDPVVRYWTDGDVTPETGQTTRARLYRVDTNAVVTDTAGITGTSVSLTSTYSGTIRLQLSAERGGLSSYQSFEHEFTYIATEVLLTESGEVLLTESGEELILET